MECFKYPHLFEPMEIAGTLFRNRIIAAPTAIRTWTGMVSCPTRRPPTTAASSGRRGGRDHRRMRVDSDYGRAASTMSAWTIPTPALAGQGRLGDSLSARYPPQTPARGDVRQPQTGANGEAFRGLAYGPSTMRLKAVPILAIRGAYRKDDKNTPRPQTR
jgi:hypothetical protein